MNEMMVYVFADTYGFCKCNATMYSGISVFWHASDVCDVEFGTANLNSCMGFELCMENGNSMELGFMHYGD